VRESTGLYPRVRSDGAGAGVVSQAGAVLLLDTIRAAGLDRALSRALERWRKPAAVHDPAKVLCDVAVSLAVGGDCLADVAVLRGAPEVFGRVASDPTVSRLVTTLAGDSERALVAIDVARAAARRQVWRRAGAQAPDHGADQRRPLVVDVDATLVTAHSDKELAAPTFKRGFGHHPLAAFVDHGQAGTGEPVAMLLRKGNAGSNTAADHITVIRSALKQLPADNTAGHRTGRSVLVRVDGAGSTHELLDWLTARRLSYSVGFGLPDHTADLLARIPRSAWSPALDADGEVRDGAWVTELTGLLSLASWPAGMRVIARVERPHPGAQLRITDHDGNRVTAPTILLGCHQHPPRWAARPDRRPRTTPPSPSPLRGPHPRREGHRTGQPPAARIRRQPHLVRRGPAGLRAAGLDPDARLPRASRSALGTQTAAAAAVLDRRPTRLPRPRARGAPGRPPSLDRARTRRASRDHHRRRPSGLTDATPRSLDPGTSPAGGPGDPARARSHCRAYPPESAPTPATEPRNDHQNQDHERSGLA
jgi:hypothetical protein